LRWRGLESTESVHVGERTLTRGIEPTDPELILCILSESGNLTGRKGSTVDDLELVLIRIYHLNNVLNVLL
jgi:hypothetical protein